MTHVLEIFHWQLKAGAVSEIFQHQLKASAVFEIFFQKNDTSSLHYGVKLQ
jgi:hypothetical protein